MKEGQKVKIVRTTNKHANHLVGQTGVIRGPFGPLGMLVVWLDNGGGEYWARACNLVKID